MEFLIFYIIDVNCTDDMSFCQWKPDRAAYLLLYSRILNQQVPQSEEV